MTKATSKANGAHKKVSEAGDDAATATTDKPKRAPRKRIRRTTVEEFSEPLEKAGEPVDETLDAELVDDEDSEEEFEPMLSDAEIIMQNVVNDNEYTLRVDKLINYEHDGRTDLAAAKDFCTNIKPPTLDYLNVVARTYGGGQYLMTLFKRGAGVVRRWDEGIVKPIAPPVEPPPAPVAAPAAITQPAEPPPVDPLRKAIENAITKRIEKIADEAINPPQPAPPAPVTVMQPAQPSTLDMLLVEEAKTNADLRGRIIDKALGNDGEDEKVGIVADILKNPQESLQLFGGVLQMIKQTFLPNAPAPTNGNAPQQQLAPPDPTLAMLEPFRPLLEFIAGELVNNEPHDQTLEAIERTRQQNPALQMGLDMLVSMSSVEVLNLLARFTRQGILLKLKHGAEWVETLQDELRPEDEGEGGGAEGEGGEGESNG